MTVVSGWALVLALLACTFGIVTRLPRRSDKRAERIVILVPLAVLWGGYTLVYYGYCMMQGEGMGIGDLVMPNRWGDADVRYRSLGQPDKPSNMDPSTPGNVGGGDFTALPKTGATT